MKQQEAVEVRFWHYLETTGGPFAIVASGPGSNLVADLETLSKEVLGDGPPVEGPLPGFLMDSASCHLVILRGDGLVLLDVAAEQDWWESRMAGEPVVVRPGVQIGALPAGEHLVCDVFAKGAALPTPQSSAPGRAATAVEICLEQEVGIFDVHHLDGETELTGVALLAVETGVGQPALREGRP